MQYAQINGKILNKDSKYLGVEYGDWFSFNLNEVNRTPSHYACLPSSSTIIYTLELLSFSRPLSSYERQLQKSTWGTHYECAPSALELEHIFASVVQKFI